MKRRQPVFSDIHCHFRSGTATTLPPPPQSPCRWLCLDVMPPAHWACSTTSLPPWRLTVWNNCSRLVAIFFPEAFDKWRKYLVRAFKNFTCTRPRMISPFRCAILLEQPHFLLCHLFLFCWIGCSLNLWRTSKVKNAVNNSAKLNYPWYCCSHGIFHWICIVRSSVLFLLCCVDKTILKTWLCVL